MELNVIDNKGKKEKTVQFDESVLPSKASTTLLHEEVVAHLANQRAGTHSTKNRSAVSGGGVKPWRQKGTGRARAGSIRSPLWRKGGVIFGPVPRSYRQDLPKQKKRQAFRMAIKSVLDTDRLHVVEPIVLSDPKTKNVAAIYKKWNASGGAIFVVEKIDAVLARAARNIADVQVCDAASLNTYICLKARQVFVTPAALEQLSARMAKSTVRN